VIAHKLTAFVDIEGIFCYVSHLVPAGRHDIDCMREILPELQSVLDSEDALLLDKGYIGIQRQFWRMLCTSSTESLQTGLPLEEELKKENRQMKTIRRHIEP
jgi:hypothetical protein